MRKYISLVILSSFFLFTSCEKETEGISKITYYTDLTLNGLEVMVVRVGDAYTDPGYVAIENEVDVTANVIVTGTVDVSTPGAYTLVYSVENKDGFAKSAERLVLVAPKVTSSIDLSGVYSGQRDGQALVPSGCSISMLSTGVFEASDFFGGYYEIVRAYGPAYRLSAYFYLNEDNTYSALSTNSPWGPWGVINAVYTPATKVLKHRVTQGTTGFNITLTKK